MKKVLAGGALAFLVLTNAGCIVTSVYPYYSDDTVVFEPALLGTWLEADGKTRWTVAREGDKAYRVEAIEQKAEAGPATDVSAFAGHLFRLDGAQFIDLYPTKVPDLSIGGHFLVRIDLQGDILTTRALDTEAFDREKAANGPVLHVHRLDDGTMAPTAGGPGFAGTLLMAPTPELQAFLRQHGPAVFETGTCVLRRQK